jgi:hypothetical protein
MNERKWWLNVGVPVLLEWIFALGLVIGLPLSGVVQFTLGSTVSVISLVLALVLTTRGWRGR